MEDLEGELRARDNQRAEYDSRVAAVLARVDQQIIEDFVELEQPRADMVKKHEAMEKSAGENDFGMALDYRAQVEFALPAQWKTMTDGESDSPVDYENLLKLAANLRDEVDSILAALEAEEGAAKTGGGRKEEKDDDDGKWEWLENTGKKIVKDLEDKLIDEAFDQVGGRIDAIWDAENHLNDAYNSYQDEDYWGVLSDTTKALKDTTKAHPVLNNPATKKIVQAVEWADDALGVYEKGAAIYDWVTD